MTDRYLSDLAMLQHGDSAFPSGAVSFSWGLEALVNRNSVNDARGVEDFLRAQLEGRWASIDRSILVHAHAAWDNLNRLVTLDGLMDSQSLATELRMGSRRIGRAFLSVHIRLGTLGAAALNENVANGMLYGHAPVVQGAIWREMGFTAEQAQLMAAHGLCSSLLGAAVRLSVIGHFDAQVIRTEITSCIAEIITTPPCKPEEAHGFTPQIEIASMLHETDQSRLFVN
ncbi:urease accessory protein UreF [Pontibaca salina]|uniref:Urease accessory protein UreF n=1 Tax=Pontibaca salina TaxID=2795731 RepID=A0A934LYN0_9RHOB|nr:urease accessory UreF family protein [Pontibaca salina]MBI6629952.1 urease accessory protein UreF [Pontibaca salina]